MDARSFALGLAIILSLVDFFTDKYLSKKVNHSLKLKSFAAGAFASYLILSLFPELARLSDETGQGIYLLVLFGFAIINLAEHYMSTGVEKAKKRLFHAEVHFAISFGYKFLIGFLLTGFAEAGIYWAIVFFIPFLLHMASDRLPDYFLKDSRVRILNSLAPVFGTGVSLILSSHHLLIFPYLLSILVGAATYNFIRESIPSDKAEKPFYLVSGMVAYLLFILTTL